MDSRSRALYCDVCRRQHHPQRLPFLCAMDARNALYEGRIANATGLMEMDELEHQINTLLAGSHPGRPDQPASESSTSRNSRAYIDNCTSEEAKAKDSTDRIISAAEQLQKEIDQAKKELEERKAAIARRKSDLASVSQGIPVRRNRELEEVKKAISRTKYLFDKEHETMTQYRAALCTEVAKLYRLQRVKRSNPQRFEYKIGGIEVISLIHLNSTHPELVSASLGHITHLLYLAAHYLAVRLPAEITLSHNDYPHPTIFSLASSYHHGEVPFPGTTPLPSDTPDRTYGHIPHPRPLFLDKPLATLLKEDNSAYTSFIEGLCLLAYDIVWLCRTQGVSVGSELEDFSNMGRNLYNLLIGSSLHQHQHQHHHHHQHNVAPLMTDPTGNPSTPASRRTSLGNDTNNTNNDNDPPKLSPSPLPTLGTYSHGTAHTPLLSATGQEFTRSFKLPNPKQIVSQLKIRLLNEAPAPEWELIDDDEFANPDDLDDGVLVGGTPQTKSRAMRFGLESYMSVNTVRGSPGGREGGGGHARSKSDGSPMKDWERESDKDRERERGSNGWTKVKPR